MYRITRLLHIFEKQNTVLHQVLLCTPREGQDCEFIIMYKSKPKKWPKKVWHVKFANELESEASTHETGLSEKNPNWKSYQESLSDTR